MRDTDLSASDVALLSGNNGRNPGQEQRTL